jgi:hypothetical protein
MSTAISAFPTPDVKVSTNLSVICVPNISLTVQSC